MCSCLPAWRPCATLQGCGRPLTLPHRAWYMGSPCLPLFIPASRPDNTPFNKHSVPCPNHPPLFLTHLISLSQEGVPEVISLNRASSPAIPSRYAPSGWPVDRRMATADSSSPARRMPPTPRCGSTSCISSLYPPCTAGSAAIELPMWLFQS